MPIGDKKFVTNSPFKSRQKFEVVQRNPRTDIAGVKVGGREVKFGKKSRMAIVDDPGLARDIHYSSGQGGTGDVVVVPVEEPPNRDHARTFTVPKLPWKSND